MSPTTISNDQVQPTGKIDGQSQGAEIKAPKRLTPAERKRMARMRLTELHLEWKAKQQNQQS